MAKRRYFFDHSRFYLQKIAEVMNRQVLGFDDTIDKSDILVWNGADKIRRSYSFNKRIRSLSDIIKVIQDAHIRTVHMIPWSASQSIYQFSRIAPLPLPCFHKVVQISGRLEDPFVDECQDLQDNLPKCHLSVQAAKCRFVSFAYQILNIPEKKI